MSKFGQGQYFWHTRAAIGHGAAVAVETAKRLITGLTNGDDIGRYKGTALADFIYVFSPTKNFFACTSGAHKGKLLVHDAECDSMFAEDATFDLVLMQRDCM